MAADEEAAEAAAAEAAADTAAVAVRVVVVEVRGQWCVGPCTRDRVWYRVRPPRCCWTRHLPLKTLRRRRTPLSLRASPADNKTETVLVQTFAFCLACYLTATFTRLCYLSVRDTLPTARLVNTEPRLCWRAL